MAANFVFQFACNHLFSLPVPSVRSIPPAAELDDLAGFQQLCQRVLGDYLRILQDWKERCAPQSPEDAIDPRYAEACHMLERIGNMLDILACGTPQERTEVVADSQKDERLMRMEARNRQLREEAHGTK